MIDRIVYIGGVNGGEAGRDDVANELSRRNDFASVEAFTFSEANRNPDDVTRALAYAKVALTHSAGDIVATNLLVLGQNDTTELHAIAPPVRRSVLELMGKRTLQKTASMHMSVSSWSRAQRVLRYDVDAARELALHPISNLRPLRAVGEFDWRELPVGHQVVGLMDNDRYFGDAAYDKLHSVVPLHGEHDELLLDPRAVLEEFYEKMQ